MEDMNSDSLQNKSLSVSRVHSQELLDSSSASSLSVFADNTDGHNSSFRSNDIIVQAHKLDGSSPRASMDEALKSEAAFIQYVMSIPPKESCEHHRSADSMISRNKASPGATTAVSKIGLDHLDNLCKLMEQLSELRDTNSKLQKRVQYLEDLKTLHDMHKEICEGGDYSSEDALTPKPEPYKLKKSATESHCVKEEESSVLGSSRSPSRYLSRRSRSQQTGTQRRGRSKSVGHEDLSEDPKTRRLFPKWSKVKEAFGWESERKGSIKVKGECESILTPRRRSDESRQMYRHPGSPTWYQQCPSIHSSVGEIDVVDFEEDRWKKMSVVSEKYVSHLDSPHEGLRRQKSTPSPGSDKVPSYRESTELKAKASTIERDSYRNQDFSKFDKEECKRGKSPWGRVKTIIERHRDSLKRRSLRRDQPVMDCETSAGKNQPDSLDYKSYSDYFDTASKQPMSFGATKQKGCKPAPIILEPDDCSGLRTPCSSPNFQRKSRWNRMTKVWKGKKEGDRDHQSLSTPTSPNNDQDGNFTFDVIEEISPESYGEGRELSRVGSDSHVHQLALAVSSSDLMLQLQRNLSEDFHRKIQEWERIRSSGITSQSPNWDHKPSDVPRNRKKSERDDKGIKPKIKDLTWLEKELQKIEKEKQRLSKERQKYEERALRLEKLKETVLCANNSNKREVLVRTSAGEFRFEGISDAFTKKLYEWETKRGVGPELSTIALLDSSRLLSQSGTGSKVGHMQRVLSRSESSIADIGQPSHNSSNSLPSVKLPESSEVERQNHTSRANSEPDLTALVAYANGTSLSVSKPARMVTDACDVDITSPTVSKESEEEDFDRGRKGSESYFGLLEENVILLEQLKEKEDICRRLEKDLEILDEKMDEMHSHHVQETQRYREKLWEMHQQGASPRDVQGCRNTMMQLRKRIEFLESWTEKLRSERETVEVHFRHHSKEQETMTLDLLEKMRELQAAGSSTKDCGTKCDSQLDSSTIERLQDLSALLTQQTQDLEETLSQKTRQICQLKWELLNRDLSSVKKETEQHTHSAHKKRSKYAQWRSRSSEEAPATTRTLKTDDPDYVVIATKYYSNTSPEDEFKATHLANTVQELNKEVLKLTSGTSISSFTKYLEEKGVYPSAPTSSKNSEIQRAYKKFQTPGKEHSKKITVRRSSADNLSLGSSNEVRSKKETSSTTHSDDSSDEYYSRVCYNAGVKTNSLKNTDTERLLMSYGEIAPRGYIPRKKKAQKVSKFLGRKRSNTFHTNRDLQKPIIIDNIPQKCQSFRETREMLTESSMTGKTLPYLRQKLPDSRISIRNQDEINRKISEERILQQVISLGNIEILRNYDNNWLREVSSDSKIPLLMQAQNYTKGDSHGNKHVGKSPARSMSEKTKKETAIERREHMQKKRTKKRLKSPDSLFTAKSSVNVVSNSTSTESLNSKRLEDNSKQIALKTTIRKSLNLDSSALRLCSEKENYKSSRQADLNGLQKKVHSPSAEVPTITIQLPKRKQRKTSCKDANTNEEQSFTIYMPKKRSLSSEQDSSISDNSPRGGSKISHSDHPDEYFDNSIPCSPKTKTNPLLNNSHNENIRLMRLVSLDNFDSPFSKNEQSNDQQPRKRKAVDEGFSGTNTPTEEMIDMVSTKGNMQTLSKSSTTDIEPNNSESETPTKYIKSPSAPQLEWRKVCAKKISKEGAPNVRTLIAKYNQKLAESQTCRSPLSSNVSSPASTRKISTPVSGCTSPDLQPRFCSTPNSPTANSPLSSPLCFKTSNASFSKTPPSSPLSLARSEALRIAKENFIASQSSTHNASTNFPTIDSSQPTSPNFNKMRAVEEKPPEKPPAHSQIWSNIDRTVSVDDRMSSSSMDSMNIVMLRAGENCRESRMPKRVADSQKPDAATADSNKLKTSKSLSSSSLFKAVLNSDFKMPTNLLKLKRSKRKKDMSTVTELCRQSLLLTTEDVKNIPTAASHKSCPSSPELKSKNVVKSSWLHRNIFRHK